MKNNNFFSSLLVLVCLLLSGIASADRILLFPTDPWPPFILGVEGSESTEGIGTELIQAIFKRIDNVTVKIPLVPWKRALNSVELGKADAIPLLYKTEKREVIMDFTDPLFSSLDLVWYSKNYFPNGLEWETVDDFSPYTMGIASGYSYSKDIDQAIIDKKIIEVKGKNITQLLRMLAGGRVDVVIANKVVGTALIKKYFKNRNIVSMKKPIAEDDNYIAFSKKTSARDLIPKINEIIADLKKEGLIEKIIYGD
ncbi:MAG: polar amino acid transport system substrate-binding protein [Candidatus Endobugula sp.]|jgi:polar amino acid transport system substrate-binding protein